jgi:NAD(P)H-dependent FMN reductase
VAKSLKILAFAGSLRADSFNKKLLELAVASARAAGAEVTVIDLRDYQLPIFDQDYEKAHGLPENARKLKELFLAHQALLIASPEYSSSITALLKNTIDWVSRSAPNEPGLAAFQEKVAALVSASPGALGGLRGLVHLRSILGNINVLVLPDQVAVPMAQEAFNADGTLKDPKRQAAVANLGKRLVHVAGKHHA